MALAMAFEAELSAGVWTALTADVVLSDGLEWRQGIETLTPTDRCASSGWLRGVLKSAPAGTYAPDHANCLTGWGLQTKVRVKLGASGTADTVVFIGRVRRITPGVGPHASGKRVAFVATDWLDDAAELTVTGVGAQLAKRGDEILTALIDAAAVAPEAEDYDTGDATFAYALDNIQEGKTRLLQALAQVALSEFGYIYLTRAGALRFEKRTFRSINIAPTLSLDNTMGAVELSYARRVRASRVQVTVHPRRVDSAATTVLFKRYDISANQTALMITTGARVVVFGPYGDPNNANARCGGTEMVTPAATTDYLANTAADGSGTNKTAQLTVTASFTASGVSMVLSNIDAGTIYVTLLQCRGKGVYDRDPLVLEDGTGDDLVQVDMPFEGNANTGLGVAAEVLDLWSDATPCRVTFRARDSVRLAAAVALDIGDRVWVTEDASGLLIESYVQSMTQRMVQGKDIETTLGLIPASQATYWTLDDATYGQLDTYSRLGF